MNTLHTSAISPTAAEEWEAALSFLNPSQRDLEHGLELHRSSLVAESYSLGLHAPVDADALNRELDAGASVDDYKRLREEQFITRWAVTPELRRDFRNTWEAAGVSCLFINAGEESNDPLRLLHRLAHYTWLMDALPDTLSRATSVEQIEQNYFNGKRSLCLTLNGVPLAGRHQNVHDEMSYIKIFAQLGVRMMHFTYNRRNPLGDGCGEVNDGGLSDFGHTVVGEMNRLGIIIDLAHTGWRTSVEVARASRYPVLVSHSTVHALHAHVRAKPDSVIKAVLDTGGTMGITNYPTFLGGDGGINTFLNHIDYMLRKYGADSVTIGTDMAFKHHHHVASHQPIRLEKLPRARDRWERLWPAGAVPQPDQWLGSPATKSLAWTNWPLFTVGMVQRGHSDETIRKVIGGNLLRVANEVWRAAAPC